MCSHASTAQNLRLPSHKALSPPLLSLTVERLQFMLTQGVNDGLEPLLPKQPSVGWGWAWGEGEKVREQGY